MLDVLYFSLNTRGQERKKLNIFWSLFSFGFVLFSRYFFFALWLLLIFLDEGLYLFIKSDKFNIFLLFLGGKRENRKKEKEERKKRIQGTDFGSLWPGDAQTS